MGTMRNVNQNIWVRQRCIVEATRSIHIRELRSAGLLTNGVETIRAGQFRVQLAWTMPHFGGRRAYFLCPECRARVESLYAAPYLACRSCHHLAYQSENLTPLWRKSGKLRKLQEKADADTSRLPCILAKPKWMRWHTYLSLRRRIQEADRNFAAALDEVAAWSHALSGASRLACHASVAGPELKGARLMAAILAGRMRTRARMAAD